MGKPTHFMKMKRKDDNTDVGERVAAVWQRPDGSFHIKLNKGVTISWRDNEDCFLSIFERDSYSKDYKGNKDINVFDSSENIDDEVPF